MKINKKIEEKIKKEAVKLLKNGKPNWDIPHTLDAVRWMKRLVKAEGGNEKVLVTVMYFHDTGYPILEKGYSFKESLESKKSHALRGSLNARKILSKISNFSQEEINEVAFLVKNHDNHKNIKTHDRQLIFEADGLAQIDWKVVKPNFDKKNCLEWLEKYFEKERPENKWKTDTGKKYMKKLLKEAYNYWK